MAPIAPLGWGISRYPAVYPSPVEQWTDTIGVCLTQRARSCTYVYTLPEQPCQAAVLGSLVGSAGRLRCCISIRLLRQGSFSWVHRFESPLSHIITTICILGYQGIPQPSRTMDGQRLVFPVSQWMEKFNRLRQNRITYYIMSVIYCQSRSNLHHSSSCATRPCSVQKSTLMMTHSFSFLLYGRLCY